MRCLAQGTEREAIRERVQRAHALAREGLQEARRAVGALRGDQPVTAAALIRALAQPTRGSDRPEPDWRREPVEGPVGQAALRVIQEALTNVRKHAPGGEVKVTVVIQSDQVDVSVENRVLVPVASSGLAATGGGYGLRGMRERAAQLGGTLAAGPTPEGWRVELHLPLERSTARP